MPAAFARCRSAILLRDYDISVCRRCDRELRTGGSIDCDIKTTLTKGDSICVQRRSMMARSMPWNAVATWTRTIHATNSPLQISQHECTLCLCNVIDKMMNSALGVEMVWLRGQNLLYGKSKSIEVLFVVLIDFHHQILSVVLPDLIC